MSSRGRHSPSPDTGDGLSKTFKALDLSNSKRRVSKLFSKPPFLNRWAAISRHDPYLNKPHHEGEPSGDKPPPTAPKGSSQAPSTQPAYIYQAPPYPPPNPNGSPQPPALIQMPEPSVNHAQNGTGPTYDQPPHPGGFVGPGGYLYMAVPYQSGYHSGERVTAR